MTETENSQSQRSFYLVHLIILGGLMVVISILLGALWYKERMRAHDLQNNLDAALHARKAPGVIQSEEDLNAFLQRAVKEAASRPVDRAKLATEKVTLNGRETSALHLPGQAGRLYGFEPGDVIIVDAPTTAPTSRPSE